MDHAGAAPARDVRERPPGEHDDAVLEPDEVDDVDTSRQPREHPCAGGHATGDDEQHRAHRAGDQELSPQRDERIAAALGNQVPSRVQDGRGQRENIGARPGDLVAVAKEREEVTALVKILDGRKRELAQAYAATGNVARTTADSRFNASAVR